MYHVTHRKRKKINGALTSCYEFIQAPNILLLCKVDESFD